MNRAAERLLGAGGPEDLAGNSVFDCIDPARCDEAELRMARELPQDVRALVGRFWRTIDVIYRR